MGKQTDNLNALREQKALKERLYADTMGRFGGQMNDAYRNYNAQNHAISMRLMEREIQQAERLADAERAQEITEQVLKNLTDSGGKAAKDIAAELQKVLNGLKL